MLEEEGYCVLYYIDGKREGGGRGGKDLASLLNRKVSFQCVALIGVSEEISECLDEVSALLLSPRITLKH